MDLSVYSELKKIINEMKYFLEENTEGFLPKQLPQIRIKKEYEFLSIACKELYLHYHGENKNCKDFIEKVSKQIPINYKKDLENMSKINLEALMTRLSILAHAYRWTSMPAQKELYHINKLNLPLLLNELWEDVAKKLEIPIVGNFYSMISNNWIFKNCQNENELTYDADKITLNNVNMAFNWLSSPQKEELKNFVILALYMEAQGKKILNSMIKIYNGFLFDNFNYKYEGFNSLYLTLKSIVTSFNKNIKTTLVNPTNFLTHIQPTMIWLIDGLEGANGTQSCTMQLLDSFFQVDKNTDIGKMIIKSRKYMMPSHRKILNTLDNLNINFYQLIEKENNEIKKLYNDSIEELKKWRESHKMRGAKYMKGEKDNSVSHYTSSGLAVKLNMERDIAFKNLMQSHIDNTIKKSI